MKQQSRGHTESRDVVVIVGTVLVAVGLLALVNSCLVVAWVLR